NFQSAGIERDRNVDRDFPLGAFQKSVNALLETQFFCGDFEARVSGLVDVEFLLRSDRHSTPPEHFTEIGCVTRRSFADRGRSSRAARERRERRAWWARCREA